MSMTSGATKAVEAVMDAGSVLHGVRDELAGALDDVAEASGRVAGLAAGVTRAEDFLRAALELSDPTDKDAMICRARAVLAEVRKRSLGNGGPLSRLGDRWLALLERADRAGAAMADLVSAAAGARRARFAVGDPFPLSPGLRRASEPVSSAAGWSDLQGDMRVRRRRRRWWGRRVRFRDLFAMWKRGHLSMMEGDT